MNVIVIGSGVIGSIVAEQLLQSSVNSVTMLEAGPSIPMADAANWFNILNGADAPYESCYDTSDDFKATPQDPSKQWNIVGGRIFGRGGSTLHWGGWVPRFQPEDFQYYTNTGQGLDWPYTYEDLEPYYCQAENLLGVAGDSNDQTPWRSEPYPYDAAAYPLLMNPVIDALQALNISFCHMPVSRYGQNAVNRTPCMTTGTCKYCPIGGRYTGDQSVDQLQNNHERFNLILNAPALEIIMENHANAQGVTYLDATTGQKKTINADLVFVCAGALETPKILQNSRTGGWNNGVGNDNQLVGRYLMASPYFYANGTLPENTQQIESELGFPTLASRAFDTVEYQKAGGKFYFNADYASPHFNIANAMISGSDTSEIIASSKGQMTYQLQGTMTAIPSYDNQVSSEQGQTRFGLPKTLINTPTPLYDEDLSQLYLKAMSDILAKMGCENIQSGSYPQRGDHAMGTCRMAKDASQGVVDENGKVFGVNNLYVMGHATFPSMGPVNPSLTMVAATLKALDNLSFNL